MLLTVRKKRSKAVEIRSYDRQSDDHCSPYVRLTIILNVRRTTEFLERHPIDFILKRSYDDLVLKFPAIGYAANYSKEVFRVANVHNTLPPTYELIDDNNEKIQGIFYNEDLTKAASPGQVTEPAEEEEEEQADPSAPQASPAEEPQQQGVQLANEEQA